MSELKATLYRVVESPRRFAIVHRGARRALLRRFPYGLFFIVVEDRLIIVACTLGETQFGGKRGPIANKPLHLSARCARRMP